MKINKLSKSKISAIEEIHKIALVLVKRIYIHIHKFEQRRPDFVRRQK